jgi:hypothetical protein
MIELTIDSTAFVTTPIPPSARQRRMASAAS